MGGFNLVGKLRSRGPWFAQFKKLGFTETPVKPLHIILTITAVVAVLCAMDRAALWAERRGWIYWRKCKSSANALGAVTLGLQKIFESGKAKHVIEVQNEPKEDQPDPGSGTA